MQYVDQNMKGLKKTDFTIYLINVQTIENQQDSHDVQPIISENLRRDFLMSDTEPLFR